MRLTNNANLPAALVEAVRNDEYSRGASEISVTGLLKPLRAVVLERIHVDEITEDAADRIWSLYGQIVHKLLERANRDTGVITERRLHMEVDGVKVSGQMDSYEIESGTLRDFKFVTAYKFKGGEPPEDWVQQQNMYAELLRHHGHRIERLEVVGILRDHSKLEAKRSFDYPQLPVQIMPIPMWDKDTARMFLEERVAEYKAALKHIPDCTPEERWAKPDTFAVKKQGVQRAVRVFEDEREATLLAMTNATYCVEKRPGENTRCENYCVAAPFCTQFQKLKGEKK